MEITRNLLNIPTVLLLLLLILLFAGLNIFITYIIRKRIQKNKPGLFNDVVGFNFTVVSGFYALLLAFVIADALSNSSDVQKDADKEGSFAKNFYRQIRSYPDTNNIAGIKKEYLRYVNLVLEDEYPKMNAGQQSESTHVSFTKVFDLVEQIKPTETTQAKAQFLFQSINDLSTYRSLRVLAGTSEIPFAMWLTLLVGALITAVLSALLSVENFRYHLFVNALMGAFIGLLFFLILVLDHPFSGSIKTEPAGYKEILKMEKEN
jgi:hypothetical protein